MTDKDLITEHGTTKLAKLLGFSVQRVDNWKRRGVPAQVKVDFPRIFLAQKKPVRRGSAPGAPVLTPTTGA